MTGINVGKGALLGLSLALMAVAVYMVSVYVPTEQMMGIVQRIFYFHVPSAWVGFLAFFVVFICSILYLVKRDSKWDVIANCSAELGVLFTTLVLITGPIWARPVWGVWWTWEPRLTTALILWLIYVAYMLVRSYASDKQQGARFAAVVGIIGFIDVPLVFLATTWWRTQHPGALVFQSGGLAPSMLATLMVSLAAFTSLYWLLLIERVGLKNSENEVEILKESLE
ncbi:MAG: cytochrome C assembly protein [Chloroflexi bacterium RBG_16_57_8]|nr:MAG: cytochrome C assembly protein [Chloroflexi bacterium RBG_16_57_8]